MLLGKVVCIAMFYDMCLLHFCQVLPALKDKKDEYLLMELLSRWDNHKIMVRWLSRFFNYLDRYCFQSSLMLFADLLLDQLLSQGGCAAVFADTTFLGILYTP